MGILFCVLGEHFRGIHPPGIFKGFHIFQYLQLFIITGTVTHQSRYSGMRSTYPCSVNFQELSASDENNYKYTLYPWTISCPWSCLPYTLGLDQVVPYVWIIALDFVNVSKCCPPQRSENVTRGLKMHDSMSSITLLQYHMIFRMN